MKNIYTWAAKPAKRSTTVGDLKAAKGKRKFTQVTANTVDEAAAAEEAGIDYDKICVMDSCTMVKWDTPNFFNTTYAQVTAFRSLENLRWIAEGVDGYNNFFNAHV